MSAVLASFMQAGALKRVSVVTHSFSQAYCNTVLRCGGQTSHLIPNAPSEPVLSGIVWWIAIGYSTIIPTF